MKLVKYKVNKFRSIKGTDWIDIDQSACYVGVNESGKSNLLLPLWKFNPADDATMIKNHLVSKEKFIPKKEMVFIPVKGVKPVVSIEYLEVKMVLRKTVLIYQNQ